MTEIVDQLFTLLERPMTSADPKRPSRPELREWAEKLGVEAQSITVRPLKTKWASCSTAGRLAFDSQVPELEGRLQDYVIVHELLHFHVPNLGRLWKSLMRTHLGSIRNSNTSSGG